MYPHNAFRPGALIYLNPPLICSEKIVYELKRNM